MGTIKIESLPSNMMTLKKSMIICRILAVFIKRITEILIACIILGSLKK